ncbi:anti-sigma factor antagonist [Candidatus Peregrinibacteria bacterium]|nr:anti-sigma factor antagonist [Candidatus Peregrinibacteria bacterium]
MTEANIIIEDISANMKIAHVSGQLDESNVDEKIKEVYKAMEKVPKGLNMVFDMQTLDYMNSKSIGYLTDIYGKITESGGKIALAGAKPNILDILQVVGLTQLIQNFDTIDKAKESFSAPTPAQVAVAATTPAQAPVSVQEPVATSPTTTPTPAPAPVETPVQTSTPTPVQPAPEATPAPATTPPLAPEAITPSAETEAQPQPTPNTNQSGEEGTYKFEK